MAKPEVPTGPIPMDGKPDPASIKSLKAAHAANSASASYSRLQSCIRRCLSQHLDPMRKVTQ